MKGNSELANSWNIKQNAEDKDVEIDNEDDFIETHSDESFKSNKALTK